MQGDENLVDEKFNYLKKEFFASTKNCIKLLEKINPSLPSQSLKPKKSNLIKKSSH